MKSIRVSARLSLVIALATIGWVMLVKSVPAAIVSESEPNDTPETANPLSNATASTGSISPTGDVDYYALGGLNTTWGFIALLDTISSTGSSAGQLQAIGSDGSSVLQADSGSWERGSGIALQNYANGGDTHYLRVNEVGDDAAITSYTIRYYQTVVASQPEAEPNETRTAGTPSSFTHSGTISPTGDVDCFAFHGRVGDTILLALNGDPENDGSPINPVLELISPSDAVLKSVNVSGTAGREFIEYAGLPDTGVYAYCVRDGAGGGDPAATYRVGLVRNGGLYFPSYTFSAIWLNPRPGNYALIDDLMSFRLSVTNTSPISIPGNIRITTDYSPTCLSLVSVVPSATTSSTGYISWDGQKSGLAPGEVYSVTMNMRAQARCSDTVFQDLGLAYYFTGTGGYADYVIYGSLYLPIVLRNAP